MLMLMMFVMGMFVFMVQRNMCMLMNVTLGKVKPKTEAHERPSTDKLHVQRFMQEDNRKNGTEKRGNRVVRPGSCGSKMT